MLNKEPQSEEFQPKLEKEAEIDIEPYLLESDIRVFIIDDNPELVRAIGKSFERVKERSIGIVGPENPQDAKKILSRIARAQPEYFPHIILIDELFDAETYDPEVGARLLRDILKDKNVARIEKPLVFGYSSENEWLEHLKKAGADIGAKIPQSLDTFFRSGGYVQTLVSQY